MDVTFGTRELAQLAGDLDVTALRVPRDAAKVVQRSTYAVRDSAKDHAPVRTGLLRDRITARVEGLSGEVYVDGVDYDHWVEYGTSDTAPQPYMGPAVDEQEEPFVEAADSLFDDLL